MSAVTSGAWVAVLAGTLAAASITMAGPSRAQATFTGLGFLPGGLQSAAYAISADGRVVVGEGSNQAVRWVDGAIAGLGDLPGGDFSSVASAVSADGQIVVGRSWSASGLEAFRWEGGGMSDLGDLAGGNFLSRANGISADGLVIVGMGSSAAGPEAVLWAGGTIEMLGDLPGGITSSQAAGTSRNGEVIVGWGDSGDFEAALWQDAAITGLGFIVNPGQAEFQSLSHAVSFDGSVVVGQSDNFRIVFDPYTGTDVIAQYLEPFRYQDGVMTSLFDGVTPGETPGQPWTFGSALAANEDASVIVGYGFGPFIWDEQNGMRDLETTLEDDFGLDLSQWRLTRATGISADGTVIVGYGLNPSGHEEAWIVTIPPLGPEAVPALSTVGLTIFIGFLVGTSILANRAFTRNSVSSRTIR